MRLCFDILFWGYSDILVGLGRLCFVSFFWIWFLGVFFLCLWRYFCSIIGVIDFYILFLFRGVRFMFWGVLWVVSCLVIFDMVLILFMLIVSCLMFFVKVYWIEDIEGSLVLFMNWVMLYVLFGLLINFF